MADSLKTLLKKRSSIKSKLTIYNNYLNLIKSSSDISELVNEIQESTYGHTWSYVPSRDNPADLVSRGLKANVIKDTPMWWSGPSFLLRNENEWPKMPNTEEHDLPEVVTHFTCSDSDHHVLSNHSHSTIYSSIIHRLLEKYSSFPKIQRLFAYVQRFIHNLKNKNKLCGDLSVTELQDSYNAIIHYSQLEMFSEEFHLLKSKQKLPRNSRLISLTPFIDDHNLIRDKTTPPLLWSLGRVMTTYPGVDGVTRVAELKTKRGIIRRAVNCICPLPIED
ncbi:unnamed protein product [Parnassius mnemosyne]|uniref:DUF5641 domain-containing protein n=1 Tax=Parnassius mnemosyne TaxID=213953 RepID=A0AAV1LSR1_9NEOP